MKPKSQITKIGSSTSTDELTNTSPSRLRSRAQVQVNNNKRKRNSFPTLRISIKSFLPELSNLNLINQKVGIRKDTDWTWEDFLKSQNIGINDASNYLIKTTKSVTLMTDKISMTLSRYAPSSRYLKATVISSHPSSLSTNDGLTEDEETNGSSANESTGDDYEEDIARSRFRNLQTIRDMVDGGHFMVPNEEANSLDLTMSSFGNSRTSNEAIYFPSSNASGSSLPLHQYEEPYTMVRINEQPMRLEPVNLVSSSTQSRKRKSFANNMPSCNIERVDEHGTNNNNIPNPSVAQVGISEEQSPSSNEVMEFAELLRTQVVNAFETLPLEDLLKMRAELVLVRHQNNQYSWSRHAPMTSCHIFSAFHV